MEWTTMNEDDAHVSLLVLIGELLYKNQLLREAIASKDEVIELIINHLMIAATSACSTSRRTMCGSSHGTEYSSGIWLGEVGFEMGLRIPAPQATRGVRVLSGSGSLK